MRINFLIILGLAIFCLIGIGFLKIEKYLEEQKIILKQIHTMDCSIPYEWKKAKKKAPSHP